MRTLLFNLAASISLLGQVAIEHATVIDPRTRTVLTDHSVIINAGKITQVGPSAQIQPAPNHRRIDGRNRYLIPGLWDTHVHLTKAGETSLALFLANGVTSVRDMGSDPNEVFAWRDTIKAGKRPGPAIWTSGRILEAQANVDRMRREGGVEPVDRIRVGVGTPAEAQAAVAALAKLGVDHIKIRTVAGNEVFEAIADAARHWKLPLTGHAPPGEPEMLFGRMRSVEHVLAYPPLDSLSREERLDLFARMRNSGTWIGTSLVNFDDSILLPYERAKKLLADAKGRIDPRRRYIGGYLLADWREQVEERKNAPEYVDAVRRTFPGVVRDLAEMREASVQFLPGTDVGVAFIYPGTSLHEELKLWVDRLGFNPMETLRAATHNPAAFYGIEKNRGGIAAGQAADLVLLDADPLADIANTRRIHCVIAAGRIWSRERLDKLLEATRAQVQRLKEPAQAH